MKNRSLPFLQVSLAAMLTLGLSYSAPAHAFFGWFGGSRTAESAPAPSSSASSQNAGTAAMPAPPPGSGNLGGFVPSPHVPQGSEEAADPCAYIGGALQKKYEDYAIARVPQSNPREAVKASGAEEALKQTLPAGGPFGTFARAFWDRFSGTALNMMFNYARQAVLTRVSQTLNGLGLGRAYPAVDGAIGVALGLPGATQQVTNAGMGEVMRRVNEGLAGEGAVGNAVGGAINSGIGGGVGEVNRSISQQEWERMQREAAERARAQQQQQQQQQQQSPQAQPRSGGDWLSGSQRP